MTTAGIIFALVIFAVLVWCWRLAEKPLTEQDRRLSAVDDELRRAEGRQP